MIINQILDYIFISEMSCGGNRFSCALKRFDQHKITTDRPVNQLLHDENEKRLSDLLKIREEQDKGTFQSNLQPAIQSTELERFYKPWDNPMQK